MPSYESTITIRTSKRAEPVEGERIGRMVVTEERVLVRLDVDLPKLMQMLGQKAARNSRGKSEVAIGVKAKVLRRTTLKL